MFYFDHMIQKFFKAKQPNFGTFAPIQSMLEDLCSKKIVFIGEIHNVDAIITLQKQV